MDRRIIRPTIAYRIGQNRQELIGGELGYPNAANVFPVCSFVVLTANALISVASAGILACGYTQDASKLVTTIDPPAAPFGDKHFPINLRDMVFAVSVTDAAFNVGEANAAPILSEVAVGTKYGIVRRAADLLHAMNVDNVTNLIFEVVEKPLVWDGVAQTADTFNPVVLVKFVDGTIQGIE